MMRRNTLQRSVILESVIKLHDHATADEVYKDIMKLHPSISKATVYRNLEQLSADGAIRRVETPGGADHYDDRLDDHYHIICDKCGRVFDIELDKVMDLREKVINSHGFRITGCNIIFSGICPECMASSKADD